MSAGEFIMKNFILPIGLTAGMLAIQLSITEKEMDELLMSRNISDKHDKLLCDRFNFPCGSFQNNGSA